MQGVVYFDFFLFTPSENTSCKSELKAFDSLINYGKERFLTHPLLEGKTKQNEICDGILFQKLFRPTVRYNCSGGREKLLQIKIRIKNLTTF